MLVEEDKTGEVVAEALDEEGEEGLTEEEVKEKGVAVGPPLEKVA